MRRAWLFLSVSWVLIAGNCVPKEQVVPYENPREEYLNMTGTIDEDLEYVVSVMYVKNAKESGCPVFGKDSDICQVKPEQFTYVPKIKEGSHSLHIPLKELSPGTNSWWEPHDISICVGPTDPNAVPHKCQVLFSVTKDRHDGNQSIDLVCSKKFWCYQGLQIEHVSQLNREYVVNIRKESYAHGPTTSLTLEELLKYGKLTEYLERVLPDLERWNGPILLVASSIAIREQRTNDGLLLYHAGTIRVQADRTYYKPIRKGADGPGPAIEGLMFSMQLAMRTLSAEQLKDTYQAIVPQLEKWNPQYVHTYDPGWKFESPPNLQNVQLQFDQAKAHRVQTLQGLITLFSDETYAQAHSIVQAYEWDLSLDQQSEEKLQAEEKMRRIESKLGIKGYMAALTKQRALAKDTKCFEFSPDGKKTECKTDD